MTIDQFFRSGGGSGNPFPNRPTPLSGLTPRTVVGKPIYWLLPGGQHRKRKLAIFTRRVCFTFTRRVEFLKSRNLERQGKTQTSQKLSRFSAQKVLIFVLSLGVFFQFSLNHGQVGGCDRTTIKFCYGVIFVNF